MGTLEIYLHLKSLIYKKGLLFYLESWGFSPQSIGKEGLMSASNSTEGRKVLICDEAFFKAGIPFQKNYKILLLLNGVSESDKSKYFDQGVCGIFNHFITPGDLHQAIKVVRQGGNYTQPNIYADAEKKSSNFINTELTVLSDLTSREREVLRHIANELTNKEIAKILFISPRTVETHRRNLIQKMKVKNSVGLVKAYLKARSIA